MRLTVGSTLAALAKMIHPDVARTLELLDQAGSLPPMHLRPGLRVAELMFVQQFKGEAVNLGALQDGGQLAGPTASRKVRTQ